MAKRHKHAGASASVSTTLDASMIAKIAEQAAKEAETLQVMMRLEESKPGKLVYSARNRIVGGHIEFMAFEVTLEAGNGTQHVRTRILTYKQRRQWILVIPLPWQMIAWGNYKKFMYTLVNGIKAQDPKAQSSVLEFKSV